MELSSYQMFIGYVLYYVNPYYAGIFLLRLFNIMYYSIHGDKDTIIPIVKNLSPYISTLYTKNINGKKNQDGYFWCKYAIGHINIQEDTIYIITRPYFYDKITCAEECNDVKQCVPTPDKSKIDVYIRKGCYKSLYYARFSIDIGHIHPIGQQKEIVDDIISIYNRQQRATVFIHGITGAGKSTIGYLVSKYTSGVYCHSFNPTDPGDSLTTLMMDIGSTESPIVIVLEESDVIINAVHHQRIGKHVEMPTLIHNKSSWSTFLDDMIFYKGVILILTSNSSKANIDDLDTSYLREGRIHKSYNMTVPISLHVPQEETPILQMEST
jgi:hypothetical protein